MMLYYGMIYVGQEPGDWGIAGWHELLCGSTSRCVLDNKQTSAFGSRRQASPASTRT